MTQINTTAPRGFAIPALAPLFSELRARFERSRRYRETFDELNRLSDRELTDLNISRADIHRIAHEAVYG
ncbi:MAG: DUF1127 domain-containing protein [Pseudomonadota bacterium]